MLFFQRFLLRSFVKGALREHFAHKCYYPRAILSRALKGALGQRFAKKVLLGSTMLLPKSNVTKRTTLKSTITKKCSWGAQCYYSRTTLPREQLPRALLLKGAFGSTLPRGALGEHNATIQEQHPTAHCFTMRCVTYLYDNILIAKNKHLHFWGVLC